MKHIAGKYNKNYQTDPICNSNKNNNTLKNVFHMEWKGTHIWIKCFWGTLRKPIYGKVYFGFAIEDQTGNI